MPKEPTNPCEPAYPEDELYARKFVEFLKARLDDTYPPGGTLRDFHPKMHSCVRARFEVSADVPEQLRSGIFSEVASYDAWIRFSNGAGSVDPDKKRDVRGLGLKLEGVEGPKLLEDPHGPGTQDFVLVSHPTFGIRSVAEFYGIETARVRGPLSLLGHVLNPFDPHVRTMYLLISSLRKCPNILEARFWSVTPYALGSAVVKYSVRPAATPTSRMPSRPDEDFLRERMVSQLAGEGVDLAFMAQIQTNPATMPLEDPSVVWDESVSPFQRIASIHIPAQAFDTPERHQFGENLTFNPFHALAEDRPLGGANLARKIIYEEMSRYRRARNER